MQPCYINFVKLWSDTASRLLRNFVINVNHVRVTLRTNCSRKCLEYQYSTIDQVIFDILLLYYFYGKKIYIISISRRDPNNLKCTCDGSVFKILKVKNAIS